MTIHERYRVRDLIKHPVRTVINHDFKSPPINPDPGLSHDTYGVINLGKGIRVKVASDSAVVIQRRHFDRHRKWPIQHVWLNEHSEDREDQIYIRKEAINEHPLLKDKVFFEPTTINIPMRRVLGRRR